MGKLTLIVSVPLRGIGIESEVVNDLRGFFDQKFPSPCGELGSKDEAAMLQDYLRESFRPLAGNWDRKQFDANLRQREEALFPSPCGELGSKGWLSKERRLS